MICALENARQHGHLYLEVNTLIAESLQFLNEPIPLPQMQVRRAEVEQKLQQMAEDNEIVSDGGRLYLPHIFMQEVETAAKAAAMLLEHTAKLTWRFHWSRSSKTRLALNKAAEPRR